MSAPTIPGPDPCTRTPAFVLPPLACDAHCHIFGPATRYPDVADRSGVPDKRMFDRVIVDLIPLFAPEPGIQHKILVDNPARLFGFDKPSEMRGKVVP